MDEPIAQLDPIAAKEFLQTLRRVNEELGKTVILSEHRLDDMLPIADNVLYLSKAQRRFYGTPEEFAGWCIRKREEAFIPSLPAAVRLAEGMGITTDIPLGVKAVSYTHLTDSQYRSFRRYGLAHRQRNGSL